MLRVLRANDRDHADSVRGSVWTTADTGRTAGTTQDPDGLAATLDEVLLPPRLSLVYDLRAGWECFSYLRQGRLVYCGADGETGYLSAGDFQVTMLGPGLPGEPQNESFTASARVFQLRLCAPDGESVALNETKRISVAQRRGGLRLVASLGGRAGSVALRSDVDVFSAVLRSGNHVSHPMLPGRSVWMHIVDGEISVDDTILKAGDGVGVSDTALLSLTATRDSEILVAEFGVGTSADAAPLSTS